MGLKIYNTLTKQKEEFKPLRDKFVGIYVCGPTVYSHSHLGHAKSYVSFDVIVRYFRYLGYKVLYVQNITDVGHLTDDADEGEDKVGKQAKLARVHPMQIAESFTRSYFEDMDRLGILRPDISPRASGHIIEQIELIKKLIEKGFAYEVNGSVYYDVRKFSGYGKLSGRSLEDAMEGTRVEVRTEKKHPADFALWKRAEPEHIMRWQSPWGEGYPGWHIECSAMSMKYLGETFDIHGGGIDNQFPHHECEIAQSEAGTGKPFVKYWIHNNLVTVNGKKMSKSLGNFITLKEAFEKYDPMVIRFFILQSHYRSTLDYTDEALKAAKTGYERLLNTLRNLRERIEKMSDQASGNPAVLNIENYKSRFLEAMDDDFNTPLAVAILFELSKDVNASLNSGETLIKEELKQIDKLFTELGGKILGIIPEQLPEMQENLKLESDLVELLIKVRNEARQQKLWQFSDFIRDELKKLGIVLEDKKDGTTWKKIY